MTVYECKECKQRALYERDLTRPLTEPLTPIRKCDCDAPIVALMRARAVAVSGLKAG